MAEITYTIDFTNSNIPGKTSFQIPPREINESKTSLTLFGHKYPNYGEKANENFVKLLENFASNQAPPNPTIGQLWFDTSINQLKVYSGVDTWDVITGGSGGGGGSFLPLTGGTLTGYLTLHANPTANMHAATKQYVDTSLLNLNAANLTSGTIPTARLPNFTGDVTSSAGSNILTLSDSGVTAGTYTKVAVNGKGRVTAGALLSATDIPNLDASKITSGVLNNARTTGNTAKTPNSLVLRDANGGFGAGRISLDLEEVTINSLGSVSGTVNINLSNGSLITATIVGNTTFTISNPSTGGKACGFILELTNGGSATITWPTNTKWENGTAPSLTVSGVDILGFYTRDEGTTWRAVLSSKDSK